MYLYRKFHWRILAIIAACAVRGQQHYAFVVMIVFDYMADGNGNGIEGFRDCCTGHIKNDKCQEWRMGTGREWLLWWWNAVRCPPRCHVRNNSNKIVPHAPHTHTHTHVTHPTHPHTRTHSKRIHTYAQKAAAEKENLSKFKAKFLWGRALCPRRWFSLPLSLSLILSLSLSLPLRTVRLPNFHH